MAFVGVDLGGTQLRVAVADDRGNLRTVVRRATEAARGRDHVIKRIVDAVKEAVDEDGTPQRRVRALGIGLPVRSTRRRVLSSARATCPASGTSRSTAS